jgi:serine/threonine protein phosphatase PrpC
MDAKTAVDSISDMTNAQAMSQKLVDLALKKGTTDNVSCMVVRFVQG